MIEQARNRLSQSTDRPPPRSRRDRTEYMVDRSVPSRPVLLPLAPLPPDTPADEAERMYADMKVRFQARFDEAQQEYDAAIARQEQEDNEERLRTTTDAVTADLRRRVRRN